MLHEENSTKTNNIQEATPITRTFTKLPRPHKQYSRRSQTPLFQQPLFFSAAVEMSDQYFITSKVILGLAETITKIVCLEP
jgi:hypothetical protein